MDETMRCITCNQIIPKYQIIAKKVLKLGNDVKCFFCKKGHEQEIQNETDLEFQAEEVLVKIIDQDSEPDTNEILIEQPAILDMASLTIRPFNIGKVLKMGSNAKKFLKKSKIKIGDYIYFREWRYKELLSKYLIIEDKDILGKVNTTNKSMKLPKVYDDIR